MEDTDFDGLLGEEESGMIGVEPSQAWLLEEVEDVEDLGRNEQDIEDDVGEVHEGDRGDEGAGSKSDAQREEDGEDVKNTKNEGFFETKVYFAQPTQSHIRITGRDGRRVYLGLRDAHKDMTHASRKMRTESILLDAMRKTAGDRNLERIEALIEEIDHDRVRELQGKEVEHGKPKGAPKDPSKTSHATLWVEKYAPHGFHQLVSHEQVNRSVLRWLSNIAKGTESCPILLLAGPPGCGKTTLAHILAQKAGYDPVEVNASDDRSAPVIARKIKDACEIKSMFRKSNRRPCIILDEIDGIYDVSPVLRHAMQYESSQKKNPKREDRNTTKITKAMESDADSARTATAAYQKRIPIICICNDLYSHALFELRKKAVIVNMGRYVSRGKIRPGDRLQRRLNEICELERIDVDVGALVGLIHKSHHDLRSCLHTLQFLSSSGKKITKEMIESVSVASKDVATSLFQKWERVFWTRAPGNLLEKRGNGKFLRSNWWMDESGGGMEEANRMILGLFHNYPFSHIHDPHMVKASDVLEYLSVMQNVVDNASKTRDFHLLGYLNPIVLKFRMLLSSPSRPSLQMPPSASQVRARVEMLSSLVRVFRDKERAPPQWARLEQFSSEIVTQFLWILRPPLHCASSMSMSQVDKDNLEHVVSICQAYGLKIRKVENESGTKPGFALVPDITQCLMGGYEEWIGFGGISDAMMFEWMKLLNPHSRMGPSIVSTTTPKKLVLPKTKKVSTTSVKRSRIDEFFGKTSRKRSKRSVDDDGVGDGEDNDDGDDDDDDDDGSKESKRKTSKMDWGEFIFRFNEGVTNAVKRDVKIDDFLV
eukprot:TRINITY_DN612_c0_g1_i1.p1 TRINITY_DN612_c0_g1~~TRINITY_DN612_c0_g1_i1.p1  ORF type:complete len:823 (-),score=236.64 TRINITY_DN612_c0_g1_i1:1961-4429(-)